MKRKLLAVALSLVILVLAACGGTPVNVASDADSGASTSAASVESPAASGGVPLDEIKIGVFANYVMDDGGFFTAHDRALDEVQQTLGLRDDQIIRVENVPITGDDAVNVMDMLAKEGCDLIIPLSSSYRDASIIGAENHPDVKFLSFNGAIAGENSSVYQVRDQEAIFLLGYLSAKVSDVDEFGFVASYPELSVIRAVNSFMLGARYANENATMRVIWVNSWYDPPTEKEAALSLITSGVQVIGNDITNPAVQQAAEEQGAYATGFHIDTRDFAPNANLSSYLSLWAPIYIDAIQSVVDGTWHSQSYFWGMAEGCVDIAPINTDIVSPEIIAEVEDLKAKIISGEVVPFTGPLKDNQGNELLGDGEVMSEETLLNMNFLIEGIDGSL